MKKFLKSLLPILVLAFALFACEKNNGGDDPIKPPDPPKVYNSAVNVTFTVPEGVSLGVSNFGLIDINGNGITPNIYQVVNVPKFTYQVDTAVARVYLGKKLFVYFSGGRVVNGISYGFETWIPLDPLKEKNDVNVNIEYPF